MNSLALFLAGLLLAPFAALAQTAPGQRVALVVGVSDYQNVARLANPSNDAREVARRLERFGFQVERLSERSVSKRELDDALVRLRQRSAQADAVVVFFAGHGIEIGGQNYLLPSDARLLDERDVRREAVALDDVLAELRSDRPNRVNVVILDACRENPFRNRLAATGRSVSRGLKRPDVQMNGTLVAFATAANDVAADGSGSPHSPYTQALLNVMDNEPQLEIGLFFRRVRAQVIQRAPTQAPWEYGSLLGEFYLASPFGAVTPGNRDRIEDEAWALCRGAGTVGPCEDYLSGWPQGRYVALVRTRLRELQALARLPAQESAPVVATGRRPGEVFKDCADCPELVTVGTGSFTMGSPAGEDGRNADGREGPQRLVSIARLFALGRYEVTVGEFKRFVAASNYVTDAERDVGNKGCFTWDDADGKFDFREGRSWRSPGFDQADRHPVVCVSWNDAQAYLKWLSGETRQTYRLPSEAEWEYAARAGSSSARPWGDDPNQACDHANGADQSRSPGGRTWSTKHECNDGFWFTAPVGNYTANRFGLHDMIGNAWEWVQDVWHENYNGAPPTDGSAWTTGGDQARRVLRGGSWNDYPRFLRSAFRIRYAPGDRVNDAGFRIAKTL